MSRLDLPLGKNGALRDPVDEAALQRIWHQIDGRLPVARRRRRAVVGGLALAACAGVALFVVVKSDLGSDLRGDAGPLRLGDGRALVAVDAPAEGARMELSDGSSIQLAAGARFEPLEMSGTTFLAVLQRGSATFDVRPGGPRRWQVECGLATVEVVGTRFACDRGPGSLRVSVQHGAVVVRGERIANRARGLVAGQSLDVVEETGASAAAAQTAEPPTSPAPASASSPSAPRAASWRELAHGGLHREAFAVLGAPGVRREVRRAGVAELLELADVARLSGHAREAVAPLERILRDFAHDPQAPLAAFALGRLQLDALGEPRRAAASLELGVPRSLDEDVRARLAEAHEKAGDRRAAAAVARAYLRQFPAGRHRAAMESRLAPN